MILKRVALACAALLTIAAGKPSGALEHAVAAAGFKGVIVAGDAAKPSVIRSTDRQAGSRANWRWASVTKQITAVIVMQEVAAGHLALDAPVKRYWPEWPQVFADEITIRDLLQHTSGLADPSEDTPLPDGLPAFYRPAHGGGTMQAEATGFCADHPREKPGAGFHYDNCDFIVLGALLERMMGKSYGDLVRDRVASPAGLKLGLFQPGIQPARQVGGLDKAGRPDVIGDLGTYGAAGALYGSPLTLYAFDRALIAHTLLDAATTDLMWTGDPKLGAAALGQWQYQAKLAGCAAPVSVVERRGQIGGVQIRNFILPQSGHALVLFTRYEQFEFGEVWQGKGFAYDALSAIGCTK